MDDSLWMRNRAGARTALIAAQLKMSFWWTHFEKMLYDNSQLALRMRATDGPAGMHRISWTLSI